MPKPKTGFEQTAQIILQLGSGNIKVKSGDVLWFVNQDMRVMRLPVMRIVKGSHASCNYAGVYTRKLYDNVKHIDTFTTERAAKLYARTQLIQQRDLLTDRIEELTKDIGQ